MIDILQMLLLINIHMNSIIEEMDILQIMEKVQKKINILNIKLGINLIGIKHIQLKIKV